MRLAGPDLHLVQLRDVVAKQAIGGEVRIPINGVKRILLRSRNIPRLPAHRVNKNGGDIREAKMPGVIDLEPSSGDLSFWRGYALIACGQQEGGLEEKFRR